MFSDTDKKSRKLFLFNDLLILCRKDWREKHHVIEKTSLKDIRISDISDGNEAGGASLYLEIEVLPSSEVDLPNRYVVATANLQDKTTWLDVYKGLVKYTVRSKILAEVAMTSPNDEHNDEEDLEKQNAQRRPSVQTQDTSAHETSLREKYEILENELAEANRRIQKLNDTIESGQLKQLDIDKATNKASASAMAVKDTEIKQLKAAIDPKNKHIAQLRQQLKTNNMPVIEYNHTVDMPKLQTEQLHPLVDDSNGSETKSLEDSHRKELSRLSETIEMQKKALEENQQNVDQQSRVISSLQIQINESIASIQQLNSKLDLNEAEMEGKDAKIIRLEVNIKDSLAAIRDIRDVLYPRNDAIASFDNVSQVVPGPLT